MGPVHWDDVEGARVEKGPMAATWQRLGDAAGAKGIGLNRVRVEPGRLSTPPHSHGLSEEITYVLAGSGLLWQDEAVSEVGPGDTIVQVADHFEHTFRGGPDGLEYVVFGTRHPVEYGWLPRSKALRLGYAWAEGRVDNPWAIEAEVGELEFPEPGERPSNVVALEDVPVDEDGDRLLAAAAGSERSGLNWIRRPEGKRGCPPHCHSAESEAFVVLEGSGTLELEPTRVPARNGVEPQSHELRAGHVFARPPGSRVAHSIVGGEGGVTYLAYGTREPNDIAYYPRSNKVYFRGVGLMTRLEQLDYDDGEPDDWWRTFGRSWSLCLNGRVATQVEELPDNKVRLTVDVPQADLQHAVEHATHDLAEAVKVPGFRKGKVPPQVLQARIGRERIFTEAVESHIGGWFMNAAATTNIRPVAAPDYDYELPSSEDDEFQFTATVAVQPKPEPADWSQLEVPYAEPEVPQELVEQELEALRETVAELAPVEDRSARTGDVLVVDALDENGEGQRDLVVELGSGRLVEEIERALTGASPGETKEVEFESVDGTTAKATVAVKEIKEKMLPPLDDELARAASEFDTLAELRGDLEQKMQDVLEEEAETQFRAAAVDTLVQASNVQVGGPLVEARTRELLNGLGRSLEARGISAEAYFQVSGQTAEQLVQRMTQEAALSVARELVLEAVADKLELEVSDEEIEELIREQAEVAGDDPDESVKQVFDSGRQEVLRADLRLRKALDRVAAESKRIPAEVARAREEIWTPDKESQPTETKLWTPGSKEPA